ncbi:GAF domain-containing protein [Candidatus Woesearchaeota archaeon]|nr:GAF domain-containing protein [Candidatus Woesearchaeota archaeon]
MRDLDAILKEAGKLVDSSIPTASLDSWTLLTFDDQGGLVVRGTTGKAKELEEEPAGEGTVSYYVATQRAQETLEPLVVQSPDKFFSEYDLERKRPYDKSPFLVAPIVENGGVVGVLSVNYKRGKRIKKEHIEAIQSFAMRPSEAEQLPLLLIESDGELRQSIESHFTDREHLVETVESVGQAIEYLKEGSARLIIASQQEPDDIRALYDGLESIGEPGFPVVLCGGASTKEGRTTEVINTILSYAGVKPIRMPSLVSPATTDSGMIRLLEVAEAIISRSGANNIGLERGYFGVPTVLPDDAKEPIRIAMRLLAEEPDNQQMRQFISVLHAQQVVRNDFSDVEMFSPSRHTVYSIITSGDVGKVYRTGSRVAKIEEMNYMFFEDVNEKRSKFLREQLDINEDYLTLAKRRGPPQRINGHYLLTLAKVDGDLLYQKCLDGEATLDELKKVGVRLARFQVEGANGFNAGDLDLIDVVKAAHYRPVTRTRKVPNQVGGYSIYFRNRLNDVFFGQLEKGGINVPQELRDAVLHNYFINHMLVGAHESSAEYYVDGNPRDWILSYPAEGVGSVTKIDLENNRFYSGFMDIASLLEFGISEDGHTAKMSEQELQNILDRIMLEKVRAWAVVRGNVDKIKAIDSFLEHVERADRPYASDGTFYELISEDGSIDGGKTVRNHYTVMYYAAACHKNPEWAGHKTKFATEAASIIPNLDPDNPYKEELEISLKNYPQERSRHIRRVGSILDIMLEEDKVPSELSAQAHTLRENWARMVHMYFQ